MAALDKFYCMFIIRELFFSGLHGVSQNHVRSAIHAASQLPGGGQLMCIMHLRISQKPDDLDDQYQDHVFINL